MRAARLKVRPEPSISQSPPRMMKFLLSGVSFAYAHPGVAIDSCPGGEGAVLLICVDLPSS